MIVDLFFTLLLAGTYRFRGFLRQGNEDFDTLDPVHPDLGALRQGSAGGGTGTPLHAADGHLTMPVLPAMLSTLVRTRRGLKYLRTTVRRLISRTVATIRNTVT